MRKLTQQMSETDKCEIIDGISTPLEFFGGWVKYNISAIYLSYDARGMIARVDAYGVANVPNDIPNGRIAISDKNVGGYAHIYAGNCISIHLKFRGHYKDTAERRTKIRSLLAMFAQTMKLSDL
jgi:hypothetical protein